MKTTLTKKAKRLADEKAALRQRVRDIACGAAGYEFDKEEEFATCDFLSRFVPALQTTFAVEGRDYLWCLNNLGNFDTINSATDFLFTHGVRA